MNISRRVISILLAAMTGLAQTAVADSTKADCSMFRHGEEKPNASGACNFSQRQGNIDIKLHNGHTVSLTPMGEADHYKDKDGHRVVQTREKGDTHRYKWDDKYLVVDFNSDGYFIIMKGARLIRSVRVTTSFWIMSRVTMRKAITSVTAAMVKRLAMTTNTMTDFFICMLLFVEVLMRNKTLVLPILNICGMLIVNYTSLFPPFCLMFVGSCANLNSLKYALRGRFLAFKKHIHLFVLNGLHKYPRWTSSKVSTAVTHG